LVPDAGEVVLESVRVEGSGPLLMILRASLAAAAGEDRRPVGKACPLLLAVVGREANAATAFIATGAGGAHVLGPPAAKKG